jgi:hypothetical protein
MKKGIKLSLNIKTALKTAILTLFLGLFLFDVALADVILAPFTDDFETYSTGNLPSPWVKDPNSAYSYWIVNTEKAYSGSKSIKSQQSASVASQYRTFDAWTTGAFEFYFFPTATSSSSYVFSFSLNSASYEEFRFYYNGNGHFYNVSAGNVNTDLGLANLNQWNKIQLQFDSPNKKIRYNINNAGWTDWLGGYWQSGASVQKVYITYYVSANAPVYLDKIDNVITPISSIGGTPDVFPTNPPDQAETIVNWASTTFSGQVKIPNDYEGTCHQMDIKIMPWAECLYSENQIISFNLGNLTKNYTFDYSTTTAIQIPSAFCPYLSVSYVIFCVRNNELEQFYHWKNAYIKYSAETPSPTLAPWITELPTSTEEVSCDNYSGIDKFICEIRNFFAGLFTPSPEKILNLKQKIETLKTQFPVNYISKTKDFFDDLNNQLSEDIPVLAFTIPFSTSTQNVDFQFWQASISFAGISQTILAIFKTFFTGLFILIFVAWAINFIKRIL